MLGALPLLILLQAFSPFHGAWVNPAPMRDTVHLRVVTTAELELPGPPPVLVPGSDGRVAVPLPWAMQVAVVESDGSLVGRVGADGEAPGQFRQVSMVGWRGDTLWVADQQLYRVTLFAPDWTVLRTEPTHSSPLAQRRVRVPLPAGGSRWVSVRRVPEQAAREDQTEEWVEVDAAWRAVRTVLPLAPPPPRVDMQFRGVRRAVLGVQPFSAHRLHRLSADGATVTVVDRSTAAPGTRAWYRVTRVTLDGDTVLDVRREVPSRLLTDGTRRAVLEHYLSRPSVQRSGLSLDTLRIVVEEAIELPAAHPAVSELALGVDGSTWLRREDTWEDSVLWEALDRTGAPQRHVRADRKLRHLAPDGGGLWAVREGARGWEVVRYEWSVQGGQGN